MSEFGVISFILGTILSIVLVFFILWNVGVI